MNEDELIQMSKEVTNNWIKSEYFLDEIEIPLYDVFVNVTDSIPYGTKNNIQYFRALIDCTLFNNGVDDTIFEFIYDTMNDKIRFVEYRERKSQECSIGGN